MKNLLLASLLPGIFFLVPSTAARADDLFPAPLKLNEKISQFLQIKTDPRGKYQDLVPLLEKEGIKVQFVVGKADHRFVGISPELWAKNYDYENFSFAGAFGRMLCAGHPRNLGAKPVIVVRADEPGDTLLHEFLHFLQSKRSKSVCSLYQRLEKNPSAADTQDNLLLEYEVVRILYEQGEFSSEEIQIALLDKLQQYSKSLSAEERKRVDDLYGWTALKESAINQKLAALLTVAMKKQKELPKYSAGVGAGKDSFEKQQGKTEGSFALLVPSPHKLADLPLCVSLGSLPDQEKKLATSAVEKWNAAGSKLLQKPLFRVGCNPAKVKMEWDENSGRVADGIVKFGEVRQSAGQAEVLVRKKEWNQYQWTIAAMIRQSVAEKSAADRGFVEKKLMAFKKEKEKTALENFFLH